jgi:site-specific DNA-methyltransferase (adenine-specific)
MPTTANPTAPAASRLSVRTVRLGDLHPDPANARTHDDRNLDAIAASLKTFGQVEPLVVQKSTGKVIGGNGRLAVLKRQGATECDIVEVDVNDTQAAALGIALNRSSELAEWNDEALAKLLQSLPDDAFAATGFGEDDLKDLLDKLAPGTVEEDEVPEPQAEAVSRTGDLWLLGGHRLLCGDSTNAADVDRVMAGENAALCLTDPPFGVSYVGKTAHALEIENDSEEGLRPLLEAALGQALRVCRPGAVWYVAAPAGPQFAAFAGVLGGLGVWRQTLAWVKDSMVLGHSDYHYRHEAFFYGWTPGASHRAPPDRTKTSVLEFARPKASREHPTMKPLALWAELMANSTARGDLCYEPFSGSGTSIITAEQLGRRCHAIEIDPRYVDVGVRRWQKQSGLDAVLDGDGRSFAEVEAERLGGGSAREKAPESSGAEGDGDEPR